MLISPVSINISRNLCLNKNNSKVLTDNRSSDVFIRTTSFSGSKDDKSFEEFKIWADKTDFYSMAVDIINKSGTILGNGFEGTTYAIPNNEQWVIKQFSRSTLVSEKLSKPKIEKIKDISPDLNIGQFIASVKIPMNDRLAHHMYILKKQTGVSHGVPHSMKDEVNDFTTQMHLKSLKRVAQMPMKTYETLIDDIKYVTTRGYKFDSDNPYNFMIDEKNERINFVDIADKLDDKKNTQYADVLFALLDSNFAQTFSNSSASDHDKYLAELYSRQICSKFVSTMIRKRASFTESSKFTKIFNNKDFEEVIGESIYDKKVQRLKELGLYK